MNFIFSLLFSLLLNPTEQYTANSIEWLCYDSPTIVTIKFDSYQLEHKKLFDYPDRYVINGTVVKVYKGSLQVDKPISIYCSLNSKFENEWKSMIGKEVFMFLKTLTLDDKTVYYAWDSEMGVINLANPQDMAITGNFWILKDKEEIETSIEHSLEKLKGIKSGKSFLETPNNNNDFPVNMEGIYVPDFMYPNGKPVKE